MVEDRGRDKTGIQCGDGTQNQCIPFLPFQKRKLPNRHCDVTIARETDIFLAVNPGRSASRVRYWWEAADGP